jgi:hypothetical protein
MKKMLIAGLLMTAISTASFSREFVASGKTHTSLGDYKIEVADKPVTLNGEELKAFIISYQNSPMEVKVVIRKEKDCKNYFVFSDKLSVQYVCNGTFFGVQKLDKSLEKDGYKTSDAALNRSEYFHQKLIISGQTDEVDNTKLIAAYFPMLINGETLATM